MATKVSISDLAREIDTLSKVEYCVETNEGTYGGSDGVRAIGTGDQRYCNYSVYETVGGFRRHVGCDKSRAPGRARYLNRDSLSDDRKRLAELRRELREAR